MMVVCSDEEEGLTYCYDDDDDDDDSEEDEDEDDAEEMEEGMNFGEEVNFIQVWSDSVP